jgi:signal transduction histidine kinase
VTSLPVKRPFGWDVRPLRPAVAWGVGVVAAALCVLAVALVVSAAPADERAMRAFVEILIVGVPVAGGLYAARSAHNVRFGVVLIGAGLLWSLTALGESPESLPYSVGRVIGWTVIPLLIYLMLTFPLGRFNGRVDRFLFGGIVLLVTLLYVGSAPFIEAYPTQAPWASCRADCPPNAFLVLDQEPAVMGDVVQPVRELLAILLLAGVTASLAHRARTASPFRRRAVSPVILMSIVSTVGLATFIAMRRLAPDTEAVTSLGWLWSLTVPGVAAAFLVGLMRQRIMLGEALAALSVALSQRLDRGQTRDILAAVLGDPSLDLLLPDEATGRWRDADGRVTAKAAAVAGGRAVTVIDDQDGLPVAAFVHDPALGGDDELATAVRALILATLQHRRVMTRLAHSLEELDESRKRIASAADMERSRIERDLHDGAQQRLIALRIKMSVAEEQIQTDPLRGIETMHELGAEIDLALEELRSLAHGVYPSLLTDRGLQDALRSVISRSPMRVHFDARGVTRLPLEIETAVYFTCLEAIQNAVKYGREATGLWLSMRQNHVLRFQVRDDGPGFTPPGRDSSGGLRNMRDRIEAVGGRLTIDSSPGQGTRIGGVVPLDAPPDRTAPDSTQRRDAEAGGPLEL